MAEDLDSSSHIDLATVQLDYELFRKLSRNPNLSPNERIGFPDSYRDGHDHAILADIVAKLPRLTTGTDAVVLDIGPGCAQLPRLLIELCKEKRHALHLVDSPEMLDQIPDVAEVTFKRAGMFPRDYAVIEGLAGTVDVLLCYSVFHYIFVDANPFTFIDRCVDLLAPGGRALIGDIPNVSKRRRFFSSETGRAFHRTFTGTDSAPPTDSGVPLNKIDDSVIASMVARAQASGCDAYVVPQSDELPMANRREDLLLIKP